MLTALLIYKLKAAPNARIVSVASQASMAGKIYFDDLQLEKNFSPVKSYAQSKLANIMFTYKLARKLQGTKITANCLHPGVVKTYFANELNGFWGFLFKKMGGLMRTAEKGAETIIWLASSPDVANISGKYFKDKKELKSPKLSYDVDVQERLWKVSEQITNTTF